MINRRQFIQAAAGVAAVASIAGCSSGKPATSAPTTAASGGVKDFAPLKQVNAGPLNIGYAEAGPANGRPVILFHGWPFSIHSYVEVAPILAAAGYRVLVPFLRGFGTTTFLSASTVRNAQQATTAQDAINFMDALHIDTAILGGYDWGGRTATSVAALWPERVKAATLVSGYLLNNLKAQLQPAAPAAEYAFWYEFYFATERGALGYAQNLDAFNKLIWHTLSPTWNFSDAVYEQSAQAFKNPDHVAIVIDNYRWMLSLAPGEAQYDAIEQKLQTAPSISVPTITIGSDFDGANLNGASYRDKFTGKYQHREFKGIGHNVPQEAPKNFAQAVIDTDHL